MAKRKKYKTTNMNVLDKYRNKEQVFAIINQPNIIDYKRDIHIFICDANAKFQFQQYFVHILSVWVRFVNRARNLPQVPDKHYLKAQKCHSRYNTYSSRFEIEYPN